MVKDKNQGRPGSNKSATSTSFSNNETTYDNVTRGPITGRLVLCPRDLVFIPNRDSTVSTTTTSNGKHARVMWTSILKHRVPPAKLQLKLLNHNMKMLLFGLPNQHDLERLDVDITERLTRSKRENTNTSLEFFTQELVELLQLKGYGEPRNRISISKATNKTGSVVGIANLERSKEYQQKNLAERFWESESSLTTYLEFLDDEHGKRYNKVKEDKEGHSTYTMTSHASTQELNAIMHKIKDDNGTPVFEGGASSLDPRGRQAVTMHSPFSPGELVHIMEQSFAASPSADTTRKTKNDKAMTIVTSKMSKVKNAPVGIKLGHNKHGKLCIAEITKGGSLAKANTKLQPGMEIMSINGMDCTGRKSTQAAKFIKQTHGILTIRARQLQPSASSSRKKPGSLVMVPLWKKSGDGQLGIGLEADPRTGHIVVTNIKSGTAASQTSPMLEQGMILKSINNKELKGKSAQQVVQLLSQQPLGLILVLAEVPSSNMNAKAGTVALSTNQDRPPPYGVPPGGYWMLQKYFGPMTTCWSVPGFICFGFFGLIACCFPCDQRPIYVDSYNNKAYTADGKYIGMVNTPGARLSHF